MEKIEVKMALSVFDKIRSKGEKQEDAYCYGGLTASSDFDGYTVTLADEKVTLYIYFHNSFKVEYDSTKYFDEFMLKMQRINEED